MIKETQHTAFPRWLTLVLLIVVLLIGGYLRTVGLDWDEEQHLHPDERFLTMVESSIEPVDSPGAFFQTEESSLNPNNRGHGFYVYGTLPIFLVRYAAEWAGMTGYGSVYLVGRALSAAADLLTVVVVFFLGTRLFDRRVGLLAAALSALAVLQIQQAHFFTVDTFTAFFMVLALYFAAEVSVEGGKPPRLSSYLLFGLTLGMATASKINAAPIALTLPLAALIAYLKAAPEDRSNRLPRIVIYLAAGAFTSLAAFRIFQPYAFQGPGLLGILPNETWVNNLQALRAQTSGDVDFPPALQWARRPVYFSWLNMVVWGMGLPYGLLAWAGFAVMGWNLFKGRNWDRYLLLWSWTALYFVWQSLQWNSTMRYQLPIYPLLAVMAGWLLVALWDSAWNGWQIKSLAVPRPAARAVTAVLLAAVLLSTAAYAYAFSRIYPEPHPRVEATRWLFDKVPGAVTLILDEGEERQLVSFPEDTWVDPGESWSSNFTALEEGSLTEVLLPSIQTAAAGQSTGALEVVVTDLDSGRSAAASGTLSLSGDEDTARLTFDSSLTLEERSTYMLEIKAGEGLPAVSFRGAAIANESSWDDGLPLRMDGYDPFGGIYQGGLNFEMYWDDNQEKLERFTSILQQADYVLITSSRQWATTTRVPERYPLTTAYYRLLMGCPIELTVEACYNRAQPGTYQGELGFELVRVFQSRPHIDGIRINDQAAEEAFTVYDHPKVFIFRKSSDYDQQRVEQLLGAVDLSRVIRLTPREADSYPGDLMLPPGRLQEQREGGTWSELFDTESALNRSQFLGSVVWYLSVFALGLLVYPLTRNVFSGLADRGYPLSRLFGLLLLSYLVWLAGSARVPFTRLTIAGTLVGLTVVSAWAAYRGWDQIKEEWKNKSRYLAWVEALALAVFLIGLLVRLGNPDLWHPWKGGEKPMDFSYFNAVLKSTSFPPYDPWFAGGYINYYYYGFVLVGVPVKLLGIVPAAAYNLILPTLLMLIALGAFSIAWNLIRLDQRRGGSSGRRARLLAGLGGVLGMVVLGNLGTVRMIARGLQRLAGAGVDPAQVGLFRKIYLTLKGLGNLGQTAGFPFRLDEWYWNPSRAIAAEHGGPITEFPVFTFLYGDLHAHFIALPLTLLVLGWGLSVIARGYGRRYPAVRWGGLILTAAAGALFVGSLRPTNTWDFYPYLLLGGCALLYSWWGEDRKWSFRKAGTSLLQIGSYVGLAFVLFQPYARWYGQGYSSIAPYTGTGTPLADYLTHWGLFLFVVVSWMGYETLHWMAHTPVSALRKLVDLRELVIAGLLLILVVLVSLGIDLPGGLEVKGYQLIGAGVPIVWLVLPLMVWAALLLFRAEATASKRAVLFMIGTALTLTLTVEIVRLEGDIGRMNTVFKFYLSAWTLLALSSAAGLGWLIAGWRSWPEPFRGVWQIALVGLAAGAALYPLMAGSAKIKDRMAPEAPHTLNGMTFMKYAEYHDLGTRLDLSQDYQAIRWMQENIPGSPVIVEANQVEYHWGTRYTVYTGLPSVVGWNWHQRQQRNLTPHAWVFERVEDVNEFYDSTDLGAARAFLREYDVEYIVVGQLERAKYLPEGIEKFPAAEGVLWEKVYQTAETVVYRSLIDR
jgi:YYY domain-containing protein